jgi:dCMP deaminase
MDNKWDKRFLELAKLVAGWSKDPSTKTGAVIVRPDKSVLSLGFNGFPKGMEDNPKWYENRESKYSRILHAEINALVFSKNSLEGCTIYTWPLGPCDRCVVQLLQAGINRFVFPNLPKRLWRRWGKVISKTKEYIQDAHASYTEI